MSFLGSAFILYVFILVEDKRTDLKNQLEFLAWHDSLTKLLNRSKFFEIIEEKRQERQTDHYIAMIDLDHFKQLNDTCGHVAGDHILIQVADIFKRYESDNMKIGRYGGEEFIMYFSHTSFERAIQTLETIRREISSRVFVVQSNASIHVTISVGIAKMESAMSLQEAVKEVDKNLYTAKEQGRDQVVAVCNPLITCGKK